MVKITTWYIIILWKKLVLIHCPMKLIKSRPIKTPKSFFQIVASVNLYVTQAKVIQKESIAVFFFLLKQYLTIMIYTFYKNLPNMYLTVLHSFLKITVK